MTEVFVVETTNATLTIQLMGASMDGMEDSECLLRATTTSVAHMAAILSSITVVNSRVVVSIADDGLNFVTENSHVCRVELTLERGLFTTYTHTGEEGRDTSESDDIDSKFTVDLVPIVEALSLANNNQISATQCTMIYQGTGHPFILIFEDSKMTERCEFSTYVNLDFEANSLGFELNQDDIVMEGMVKADIFYDALKDLKDINTDEIFIYASTQNKRNKKLAIIAKGEMGNSTFQLPNDRSILEKLSVSNSSKIDVSCYKFSLFNMALRAMKLSNKCKFKRDPSILSMNLLSLYGNDLPKNYTGTVIDFKLLQLSDKEDDIRDFVHENNEASQPLVRQPQVEEEPDSVGIEVPVFL